jgi:terminal uridylyltransferase
MAAFIAQCELLDTTAAEEISKVEMSQTEFSEKDAFRARLETICREEISKVFPDLTATLSLRAYGSIISGFATQGSDVDLTIVWSGATREDPEFKAQLPRVVEHAILKAQHGARLLSRTRVPIIKVCQVPGEELYAALMEERQKWEELSEEEKYPSLAPQPDSPTEEDEGDPSAMQNDIEAADKHEQPVEIDPDVSRSGKKMETTKRITMNDDPLGFLMQLKSKKRTEEDDLIRYCTQYINARRFALQASEIDDQTYAEYFLEGLPTTVAESTIQTCTANLQTNATNSAATTFERYYEVAHSIIGRLNAAKAKKGKPWLRERALGRLDFPKIGVGIQCDINFSNPLAMHNTELLRLYSLCDPRVQPMVLFIKAWTKRRKINSAYNGTLSSYGYVLLVLHFLINIAQPPVLPNLQHVFGTGDREVLFNGYNISFYRDEAAIRQMATTHQWTQNNEPLGVLLRNFFHYYAAQGTYVIGTGFNWMRDVISIRTPRGIMTKERKGWTGAKTITVENREIRQRYLLAIEDPFEVDHNVGRPVTHNGIVTIRDEFRRVWRILMAVGRGVNAEGGLFDVVVENGTGQTDAAESVVNTHAIASDGILQQETALKSAKA